MTSSRTEAPLGIDARRIDADHVDKLRKLEIEDCTSAKTRMIQDGWEPSRVEDLRIEFLRFMALHHIVDEPVAPPAPVDEFWHAFVLETPDYAAFCERNFGSFIHHYHDENTPILYEATRERVNLLFPQAASGVWMSAAVPCSSGGRQV